MKPSLVCSLLIAVSYGAVSGQTNSGIAPRAWFSIPTSQLRPFKDESNPAKEMFPQSANSIGVLSDQLTANSIESDATNRIVGVVNYRDDCFQDYIILDSYPGEFDYRAYRLLHQSDFLRRPEPLPDDLFSRIAFEIFAPETFRVGKTTVACSPVTAIKRKNPLCLLNPIVLNVSW